MPNPLMQVDILHSVVMHVRPRYLLKMMCCNKKMYEDIKRHPEYFWRVCAHLLYRHVCFRGNLRIFKRMQNLPRGYNYAMSEFIKGLCEHMCEENAQACIKKYREWYVQEDGVEEDEEDEMHFLYDDSLSGYELVKKIQDQVCLKVVPLGQAAGIRDLSDYIEDEDTLSIPQKRRITKSILRTFRLKLKPLSDALVQRVGDDVVGLFVLGVYNNDQQRSEKFSRLLDDLDEWTRIMCVDELYQDIPTATKHTIIQHVRSIIHRAMQVDFPMDYNNAISFEIKMTQARGENLAALHMCLKTFLYGNTLL